MRILITVLILGLAIYGIVSCDKFDVSKISSLFDKDNKAVSVDVKNNSQRTVVPSEQTLNLEQSFEKVADLALPSVVNIYTEQRVRSSSRSFSTPFDDNPMFRQFFEDFFGKEMPRQKEQKSQSLGSGFLISDNGYIVTNDHVIKDADAISVKFNDKKTYKGKVIGSDPKTDIAVIKIEGEGFKSLKLGNSETIKIGQWAIAVGNPFGLNGTLTVGVISAQGRSNLGIETYEDFIQTDASINPGNSGGPLLNAYGEVIGINTAIIASGQGIGFAIPINMAKPIIDQIINNNGSVSRSWIGVGIQRMTPELAESMGINKKNGVIINKVYPNSPASKAGVKEGDVVFSCNGTNIEEPSDLQKIIISSKIGSTVKCKIHRDNKDIELSIITEKMAEESEVSKNNSNLDAASEIIGIAVRNYKNSDVNNYSNSNGVIITEVMKNSPAEEIGLAEGDLLVSINRKSIKSIDDFKNISSRLKKGQIINIFVEREGKTFYVALPLN